MQLYVDDFDRLKNRRYAGDNYNKILAGARGFWLGWNRYDKKKLQGKTVNRLLSRAGNNIVIFVLYNITNRDENHYSRGGATSIQQYKDYVDDLVANIDRECIIIVEPDALAHAVRFTDEDTAERFTCLQYAVNQLKTTPAKVYIDVSHPNWLSYQSVINLIQYAGLDIADGFSVNVSNFISTKQCIEWADKICEKLPNMRYVIDTSRNGAKVEGWCNPVGAKLGRLPTFNTKYKNCDAFLWIKIPGESDGKDGTGAPHAGKFYPAYAKMLAE